MSKIATVATVAAAAAFALLVYCLVRPSPDPPAPAGLRCYDVRQGSYVPLAAPTQVFGIEHAYASRIEETGLLLDPKTPPAVFRKDPGAIARTDAMVHPPDSQALLAAAEALEPGLGSHPALRSQSELAALLDYGVELGFVLLQDVDPAMLDESGFVPQLGFFIAHDLSARALAILGEGRPNERDYWSVSKSFEGFLPLTDRAWLPPVSKADAIPCVVLEARVSGEIRQRESTRKLLYTPSQMLSFVHAQYPSADLREGTFVLTGTPGGVAMATPRWRMRLARLLHRDRFARLARRLAGDTTRFLAPGDRVVGRARGLGKVSIRIKGP